MTHCTRQSKALIEAYFSLRMAVLPMQGMRKIAGGKQSTNRGESDTEWNRGRCYKNSYLPLWLQMRGLMTVIFLLMKTHYTLHICLWNYYFVWYVLKIQVWGRWFLFLPPMFSFLVVTALQININIDKDNRYTQYLKSKHQNIFVDSGPHGWIIQHMMVQKHAWENMLCQCTAVE